MARNAGSFVYEIRAQYDGDNDLRRLQDDLNAIRAIDVFQEQRKRMREMAAQYRAAADQVRDLQRRLQQNPGDSGLASALQDAVRRQAELRQSLVEQSRRLSEARTNMQAYGVAVGQAATSLGELHASVQRQGRAAAARGVFGTRSDADIRREIDGIKRAYRELVKSGTLSFAELQRVQEQFRNRLRGLQQQLTPRSAADGAMNALGLRRHSEIEADIRRVQRAYETLRASGTATGRELTQAFMAMRTRIRELNNETNGWSQKLAGLHGTLAGAAAAFGGLSRVRGGFAQFVGFDDTMLKVKALTNAVAGDFAALRQRAQDLGATTRFSAAEVAEGMAEMAAAGMSTRDIAASIGAALDMAAVGGMNLGVAAGNLTDIMAQFGLKGTAAANHVADVLTQGFSGAATTMEQLNEALKFAGPVASSFGYSLEHTVAMLQLLANVGLKSTLGGTAVRGILGDLMDDTSAATKVLKSYNIEVKNTDGTLRNFADILEDIEKKGVSAGDVFVAFGNRAGTGAVAMVKQGSAALRALQEQMEGVDGLARRKAQLMESGVAGSLRALEAAVIGVAIAFGDTLAPAIKWMAGELTKLAKAFAELPDISQWSIVVSGGLSGLLLLLAPFAPLFIKMKTSLLALNVAMVNSGVAVGLLRNSVAALSTTLLSFNLGYIIGTWLEKFASVQIAAQRFFHSMEEGALEVQRLWAQAFGSKEEVAAIDRKLVEVERRYQAAVKEIMAQHVGAARTQTAAHRGAADATVQAAGEAAGKIKTISEEALKQMTKRWQEYVKQVRDLQNQIVDRERSLAAELREMGRSGMSDLGAWQDRKREAEEYVAAAKRAAEEAKAAFAEGDTITAESKWKEAIAYADDAKSAYRALNQEVKDGDRVVIGKADALKQAMSGVEEAGRLGIDILRQQKQATADAMRGIEEEAKKGGVANVAATLTEGLDEAEKKWIEKWQNMSKAATEAGEQVYKVFKNAAGFWTNVDDAFSAGWSKTADGFRREMTNGAFADFEGKARTSAENFAQNWSISTERTRGLVIQLADDIKRKLDEATKPREVVVYTREVIKRAAGGIVGAFRRGGKLPGFGGGDRISALLEAGEFVIRKEAVAKFGAGLFERLNALQLPDFSALMPQPALAAAVPSRTVNINLTLPSGDTYQLSTDPATADRIEREQARWWSLRSSNRVRRPGFGRTP